MTMKKNEIVESVHGAIGYGYGKKECFDIVETLIELIKRNLEKNDDVLISGFGKFCVKDKKARRGRNPATGEDLVLEPRRVVTFKYSGKLREMMNRSSKS